VIIILLNNCKGCGDCCKAIIISDKSWNKERAVDDPNVIWRDKHLTKISRSLALKLNPHIKNVRVNDMGFYKCDYFDYATNLCTGYNDRTEMCTKYPHYGNTVIDCVQHPHTPDCYYHNQVMYVN